MQGAVEKRRSTLAKKKEIKESGNPDSAVTSDVGDASASGTPTPVPTAVGMGQPPVGPPGQGVVIAPVPVPVQPPAGGLQMPGLQLQQHPMGPGPAMGYYQGV